MGKSWEGSSDEEHSIKFIKVMPHIVVVLVQKENVD